MSPPSSRPSGGLGKRARREEARSPTTQERRDADQDSPSSRKRARVNDAPSTRTGLLHLPVELLYAIHIYAKNPALALVHRHLRAALRVCPTFVKAHYLLGRWHEAYCYGFSGKAASASSTKVPVPNRPPLPAGPSSDLLDNGALAELEWPSRFLPVLPTHELPYPLANSFHRSADHFVLDYCLRYPLADVRVLQATEQRVLRLREFANIAHSTGLWRDDDGGMHTHELGRTPTTPMLNTMPVHLRVTEIPSRLFSDLSSKSSGAPVQTLEEYCQSLPPGLRPYLSAFGNGVGPFPHPDKLLLFLAIASRHVSTTTTLTAAWAPFNSFDGLPLAKATYAKSAFMVQLLLALGADPRRKRNLALYIAIRSGWLDGLQHMIERDDAKIIEWQTALGGMRRWFAAQERQGIVAPTNEPEDVPSTPSLSSSVSSDALDDLDVQPSTSRSSPSLLTSSPATASSAKGSTATSKRRRLLDRANLDSDMLKEAVKHDRWHVANWMRTKGVIPDLRTIQLIEMKQ